MSKVMFVPFRVLGGVLAGVIGKKAFATLWGIFDKEDAPDPKHSEIQLRKLIPALLLEGAVFRVLRGLFDHGMRIGFSRLTGTWPGARHPDQA